MDNQIVNAAPMVIDYGTQDLSTRLVPRSPELIPQHLPKFYLFAQKGKTTPELVSGVDRSNIFGDETFNYRGKYANHATVFANLANEQGNACMIQRLIPDDAGPEANLTLWLDVLPTTVDVYERNSDGSIATDISGDPIIDGTTAGYRVKWVVTNSSTISDLSTKFGAATIGVGDQTDSLTSTTSQRYPILEFKASSRGEYGNLSGIRLSAPTTVSVNAMPTKMMSEYKAYPYTISVIHKETTLATPKVMETLFGEQALTVTLKKDVIDPLTDSELYIGDTFIDSYQNLTDMRYSKVYGEFGEMHVYDANIETLLSLFHTAEIPHIDSFSDFTSAATDKHLFNFVSGVSSANVPYHSFVFVDAGNSIRLTNLTNIYAAGGSDGTMTDEIFSTLVIAELDRYTDANDEVQDLAVNVESIMYDSGFPLDAKYALCNFISKRKDTVVLLSTHTSGEAILTASEENSLAIALRTRLRMTPESDYFGTPVMRGMIVGRSGKLRNSQYTKELPLLAEILIKSAKYMGASNGRWKNGAHFDGAPGSIVEYMYDINITWVPNSVRNRNWDVGLNWVQAYDRRSYYFPALKTAYDDDTSVLNSYFTIMAIAQLNKVAHAAWREFSGVSNLSNTQLVERVNDFVTNRTQNRFDDRFVIKPNAYFTDMDLLRGFSWTLPIEIYAPNMKTVMTTSVQAFRIEDLQAA